MIATFVFQRDGNHVACRARKDPGIGIMIGGKDASYALTIAQWTCHKGFLLLVGRPGQRIHACYPTAADNLYTVNAISRQNDVGKAHSPLSQGCVLRGERPACRVLQTQAERRGQGIADAGQREVYALASVTLE